jgi:hypothetical protein
MVNVVLRSVAWTFAKKPLRRYDLYPDGALVERPLSFPSVLLDSFDLLCNLRGIRWSWSPFRRMNTRSMSISTILAKVLLKLVGFDIAHYLVQYNPPSVNVPAGDTIFDSALSPVLRCAWAVFYTACGGFVVYTTVDALYYIATLVGCNLLRQLTWRWPPLSDHPWKATSITEFWSFRWHQFFRHVFVVFGALPGGLLLGRLDALMGAFAVSAVLHDLEMWGLGRGTEFHTVGGFFLLMDVGARGELGFRKLTRRRVGGLWGWAWTMVWTIGWGSMMIDAWARWGMIASDFFPIR